MKIGVRFCGGCNPRYDRGAFYNEIIECYPDHDFEIAKEGVSYDHLVVIGGCSSCCAEYRQFTFSTFDKVWAADHKLSV